jgi:flagellar motor protein MotB
MEDVVKELKGEIIHRGKKVIIDFPAVSFFNSGKIPLTQKGQSVLEQFAKIYSSYTNKYILVIQAYTDIKKVRQNNRLHFSDNLELSALRGVSTMRILQRAGIPLRRMRVAGYGEIEMTIESLSKGEVGITAKNRLLDLARRVVLVIEPEVKQ